MTCVGILSRVYLLYDSMMVLCERGISIGDLERNAMVGFYILIILVLSFNWPHDPS